jgi:hypothetical protein
MRTKLWKVLCSNLDRVKAILTDVFVIFVGLSKQVPRQNLQIDRDRLIPHPYILTIHNNLPISFDSYITTAVQTALLNNLKRLINQSINPFCGSIHAFGSADPI